MASEPTVPTGVQAMTYHRGRILELDAGLTTSNSAHGEMIGNRQVTGTHPNSFISMRPAVATVAWVPGTHLPPRPLANKGADAHVWSLDVTVTGPDWLAAC